MTAFSNHHLEQEAFSTWEEENRSHYSMPGSAGESYARKETIHCGLIREKKVNYTGKPRGSCKMPVEEEQPPRTTPSYTPLLTQTENLIAFGVSPECLYSRFGTQRHLECIRITACFWIGGGEGGGAPGWVTGRTQTRFNDIFELPPVAWYIKIQETSNYLNKIFT